MPGTEFGEVFLDEASIARFRSGYRDLFGNAAATDPLYVSVSAGRKHPGMEHWAGLFHETMETLADYLPEASVSLDHQAFEGAAEGDGRVVAVADGERPAHPGQERRSRAGGPQARPLVR